MANLAAVKMFGALSKRMVVPDTAVVAALHKVSVVVPAPEQIVVTSVAGTETDGGVAGQNQGNLWPLPSIIGEP
jgi:hypothetical protein